MKPTPIVGEQKLKIVEMGSRAAGSAVVAAGWDSEPEPVAGARSPVEADSTRALFIQRRYHLASRIRSAKVPDGDSARASRIAGATLLEFRVLGHRLGLVVDDRHDIHRLPIWRRYFSDRVVDVIVFEAKSTTHRCVQFV